MRSITVFIITAVAVSSIALNILLKRTAENALGFTDALMSVRFALAFAVGTCAALLMLWLYVTRIDLARAILLMGALSIIGGTLIGVMFYRDKLDSVEWLLFGTIVVLYMYRMWRVFWPGNASSS